MSLKNLIFVTISLVFIQTITAQRRAAQYNHLGIQGGVTIFDISTSNFTTKKNLGTSFGFQTRGKFYASTRLNLEFDMVYGISFTNNKISIIAREIGTPNSRSEVEYTISSAQVVFLGSLVLIPNSLSFELGPVLNINGKMKLKSDRFKDYTLEEYNTLKTTDIQDISKVNFLIQGGVTLGIENFRLLAQYQYGVTNIFNKLNDKEFDEEIDFNGKSGTVILGAVIYF